jgi:hypothetical protein
MIFKKNLYIKGMDVKQNKNKRILALVAPIAIGVTLCACGGSEVAGGGPSGTEAGNAITAQIFIANAPAANARVKLVEQNSLDGNGYIATANENGFVTIKEIPIGNYTMEASLNESSVQLPVSVQNLDDTVELGKQTLQKSVYIGGSVSDFITDSTSESFKNATGFVKFRGLDHSALVTDGKFEVLGLPAGKLSMVILPSGTKHDTLDVSIKVAAGDSLTTLKPKTQPTPQDTAKKDTTKKDTVQKNSTLLIDDFEDGDNIHLLASEIPYFNYTMGSWNLTTATLSQAMIPFSPSIPDSEKIAVYPEWPTELNGHPFNLVIQDSKEGGKEVHATFDFPDTASYPLYAVITMSIGNYGYSYDLSSVDSIAFDAWGSGETEIQITSKPHYMSKTSGTLPVTLPKNKTKLKYAWADLVPSEEDRKSVTTITFAFHDDAEIHLDNVEFIGKDLMNIWKK